MSFTNIADDMKKMGENFSASYDARIGTLEDIYKDTQSTLKNARGMVKDFHGERMHMSEELRSDLEHFRKELLDITRKMINEFAKQHREMATAQREDLNEFRSSFEKMAQELHKMLTSYYKGEIQKPVQSMLNTFHNQMKALQNEFQKVHQAWLSVTRSMSAKRGMIQAPKKMMSKSDQICSILQEHPKGMTPGMIAKEMGCTSQSIRTPMMNLKKQGRISKRQNKYYFKG